MRLVGVELFRLRSRAFTWLVAALLLLVATGFAIETWNDVRPPSAATVAAATAQYEKDATMFDPDGSIATRCREVVERLRRDDPEAFLDCDDPPTLRLEDYLPQPRTFDDAVRSAADGLAAPLALAALAVAVSFVTAEFGTGSMGLWLTFVPRRSKVFASKTAAAMLGAVPLVAGGFAATVLAMAGLYAAYGHPLGDAQLWLDLGAAGLRQVALAVVVAAIGTSVAFALRHAAAVTGVLVWWVVAVELVLGEVLPAFRPVALSFNARAWLEGNAAYSVERCSGTTCETVEHYVGAFQGAAVVVLGAAAVAAVGFLVFRWRDVS